LHAIFRDQQQALPIWGVNVKNRHSFFQRFVISHLCGTSASWGEEPNMDDLILPNGRFIPVISEFRDTYWEVMPQETVFRFKGCPSQDQLCRSCIWSAIKVHFSIDTRQL